jgi:Raf kinase inhibitor-like YbhB/YbcL family protein
MKTLKITSDAFFHEGYIPSRYTCDGANVNPSLHIEGIPPKAKCLAVVIDDPDAPSGTWVHWVVWNIPVTNLILENSVPGNEGMNDFGKRHYGGPCPPSGTHRYFFKVYALERELQLPETSEKNNLEEAMNSYVLAEGVLMGYYKR